MTTAGPRRRFKHYRSCAELICGLPDSRENCATDRNKAKFEVIDAPGAFAADVLLGGAPLVDKHEQN